MTKSEITRYLDVLNEQGAYELVGDMVDRYCTTPTDLDQLLERYSNTACPYIVGTLTFFLSQSQNESGFSRSRLETWTSMVPAILNTWKRSSQVAGNSVNAVCSEFKALTGKAGIEVPSNSIDLSPIGQLLFDYLLPHELLGPWHDIQLTAMEAIEIVWELKLEKRVFVRVDRHTLADRILEAIGSIEQQPTVYEEEVEARRRFALKLRDGPSGSP